MAGYIPVRLAYNKHEPVSGDTAKSTPVIFLHGLSASKELWADIPQTVANKTKRKVYAVDARNHGDSEWSNEFNYDMNADDLFHFMDTVGERKAILVGHSMGGITAMKAALQKPERVEKIIVEDMYAKIVPPETYSMILAYMSYTRKVIEDIPPELNEEEAKKFCFQEFFKMLPKETRELKEKLQTGTKQQFFFPLKRGSNGRYMSKSNYDALFEALKKPDEIQSELTGTYHGPTHFIYGKLSIFNIPDDADTIKRFFPKAELIGIENATHTVHADCPEEYTEALLKCLAKE